MFILCSRCGVGYDTRTHSLMCPHNPKVVEEKPKLQSLPPGILEWDDEEIGWPTHTGKTIPLSYLPDKQIRRMYWANQTPCLHHPAYKERTPEEWHPILEAEMKRRKLSLEQEEFDEEFREKFC